MKRLLTLSVVTALLGAVAPSWASSSTAEILRLGDAYGLARWDEVDEIHFTFHLTNGPTVIERIWTWEPKTGKVSVQTQDSGQPYADSYQRGELNVLEDPTHRKTEGWFLHDQAWFLFPFRIVWDENAEVGFSGEQPLPTGRGRANKLTVRYPPVGAAAVGEEYQLFYGPVVNWSKSFSEPPKVDASDWYQNPYVIQQWMIQKSGASTSLTTSWEGYVRLGPLIVATEHRGKDGKFHLWFSDLSIRLSGHADWSQPLSIPRR